MTEEELIESINFIRKLVKQLMGEAGLSSKMSPGRRPFELCQQLLNVMDALQAILWIKYDKEV